MVRIRFIELANSTLLFFRDMGLDLFRSIIVNNNVIEAKTVEGLLYLIERERGGDQVDRSLLKNLLRMLSSLQVRFLDQDFSRFD